MAESPITLTAFINAEENRIHLISGGNANYAAANYRSNKIDDGFFEDLSKIIKLYKEKFPRVSFSNVSVVLSDYLFLTDMLTVPNLGKKKVENALNLVMSTTYKNKDDLDYNTFLLSQTKQNAIYGLVGIRKDLVDRLCDEFEKNGARVSGITFAANAMANFAMDSNQKIKGSTCLLLDIKDTEARFAFLNKGRTIGAYSLPFGYSILDNSKVIMEKNLFDYSSGENLVREAIEKAKAKEITLSGEDFAPRAEDDVMPQFDDTVSSTRNMPSDANGFIYENFRIFIKWALELISSNPKITSQGEIDNVYVNLPSDFNFLFDMVNNELQENGVRFAPMFINGAVPKILELSGGLLIHQYNNINNF